MSGKQELLKIMAHTEKLRALRLELIKNLRELDEQQQTEGFHTCVQK